MRKALTRFSDAAIGNPTLPLIYLVPAVAISVFLQIQLTFFKHDDYLGLRLNAADLLLPFLGILIAARIFSRRDKFPQVRIRGYYYGLAGLTAFMSFALFNGYYMTGHWDTWSVINKYIGWYVLLAYLGIGHWIGNRPVQEWAPPVITVFSFFWAAVLIYSTGYMIWLDFKGDLFKIYSNYPVAGLMGNRNAFAFTSFSALALLTTHQMKQPVPHPWGFYFIWAFMPLFYIYNASRAGLIILPFLIIIFSIINFKFSWRNILIPVLVGVMLTGTYIHFHKNSVMMNLTRSQIEYTSDWAATAKTPDADKVREVLRYEGDKVRIHTFIDGMEVWRQHPLLGGGLGSFREYQKGKRGTFSDIIDCTPLWLLAETGTVGLLAFVSFFAMTLWKILLKIRAGNDETGIYLGIFMMMMIFTLMSLVHELMYTRFLWFFMGLALAVPATEQLKKHPA